jgi:hypothetical protein
MQDLDRLAYDAALTHGGVITRRELLELGFSTRQIEVRVARGRWTIVARGVYQLAEPRDRRDVMRSVLAAWSGAVISHESAGELHGLPFVTSDRVIVSHHSRTTHAFPGVEVRRTHDLDAWHVEDRDGLRVTTVARTIIDLASTRSVRLMETIFDRAVSEDAVELFEVEAVLAAVGRRGKPGTTVMREVLAERLGEDRDSSVLERHGRRVIVDAGLPLPVAEFPIPWTVDRRFDDAYPDQRVAIEWDSRRFHGQRASFEADRSRDRDAAIHGWTMLRFTWDDVHRHPDRIVDALQVVLAA